MYLGIDLGTSGVKVLIVDQGQRIIAQANAPLGISRPHDMWSEQNPADWIAACDSAMAGLMAEAPIALAAVRGIGLSGQMHGAVLLDAADTVLRPAILWNDARSFAEAAMLDANPIFRDLTGNIVFPGFTAPKLMWTAIHEPEVQAKLAKVLLPKDYLRLWLTGGHVSDMSDASGTSWLDMKARDWSDDLLAATGLCRDHMPDLVEGSDVSGHLRDALATRWGVPAGIPVAGSGGDNAATAIGLGVVAEGDGFVSLGTSGVLFAATDAYRPNAASAVHTFCHALPGMWHQMGVILSAASAVDWYAGITGLSGQALTAELGQDLRAPGQVGFLPYLSGERTPHNDPHLTGGFFGLTHGATRADMTHAVIEGVAFALRENMDALAAAGTTLPALLAVGGGSRSRYWLNLIATVLNLPVKRPVDGDFGAAFGAARLGMFAAEGAADLSAPRIAETLSPQYGLTDAYGDKFKSWQDQRHARSGL